MTTDQALIKHLEREKRRKNQAPDSVPAAQDDDLDWQDVNCLVVWARPPPYMIKFMEQLQSRIARIVGSDLHLIPEDHLHLSVIELSHRHPVPFLHSAVEQIGRQRIQNMLDMVGSLPNKPRLVCPQLSFDRMGLAINFLPSGEDQYTYHHLRSNMHTMALESGASIDMCYTAPSAHVTLGRFVGSGFFESQENSDRFLKAIAEINGSLVSNAGTIDLHEKASSPLVWHVGAEISLELQLGYLKFGRGREKASMTGKDDVEDA